MEGNVPIDPLGKWNTSRESTNFLQGATSREAKLKPSTADHQDGNRTWDVMDVWLVVWNMFYTSLFPWLLGMSSSQLTFIFFRRVETTNQMFDMDFIWMYLIDGCLYVSHNSVFVALMNLIYWSWNMDLYIVLAIQMGMVANMFHHKKEIELTFYVYMYIYIYTYKCIYIYNYIYICICTCL